VRSGHVPDPRKEASMVMGVGVTALVMMLVIGAVIMVRARGGRVAVLVPHRSSMDRKSDCSTSTGASGVRLQALRS